MNFLKKIRDYLKNHRVNAWILFFLLIYGVFVLKLITLQQLNNTLLFGTYSILVSMYILSRFALAYFYDEPEIFDKNYQPTISFGVPSKNEEENIRETIMKIANSDYPKNKFDIIAINDGSTDNTLEEMLNAKRLASKMGVMVHVIDWKKNKGKREGMAKCIKSSEKEIMIFIDSDSFVDQNTANELVKYFSDKMVTAVAGHAYVANAEKNVLTKMQAVRYYVAFKAYKSAEALFDSVTCCSGCCSAYRKSHLDNVVDEWLNQEFLGVKCTYGDDRSLTNYLLQKGYKTLYAPNAKSFTFVPETFRQFMKQQLRWKKSWIRESMRASGFMWRKNPIMSISFYLGVILPLLAPVIVIRAMIWYPTVTGILPYFYIMGLLLMAVIYGLYYYIHTGDRKWPYGTFFATFYTLVLVWQLPWAILNLRDAGWGTR
jgi:hyaluronan synthase